MKRILAAILLLALLALPALAENKEPKNAPVPAQTEAGGDYDGIVLPAVAVLVDAWRDIYHDPQYAEEYAGHSGYLEIKNTRIIRIQDEPRSARNETGEPDKATELFGDVAYIVDFLIYADYYCSEPYYMNPNQYTSVIGYKNGRIEVYGPASLLQVYSGRAYEYYYSGIIEEIIDLNGAYNAVYHLLEE